jgi:ketosteroid isomerase-like protein
MKNQSNLKKSAEREGGAKVPWVPAAMLLALGLLAGTWAFSYFGAEARVERATAKVIEMAGKDGDESPVALGLLANRFGQQLAATATLELHPHGAIANGRQEIVQLFAQVRSSSSEIAFDAPLVAVARGDAGDLVARVSARYRFAFSSGAVEEGDGTAELVWRKGDDGWQIARALLRPDERREWPGGLP